MLANLSLLEEAKTLGGHLTILDPYNRVELHQGGRQEFIMPETFTYSRSCRWTRCSRA